MFQLKWPDHLAALEVISRIQYSKLCQRVVSLSCWWITYDGDNRLPDMLEWRTILLQDRFWQKSDVYQHQRWMTLDCMAMPSQSALRTDVYSRSVDALNVMQWFEGCCLSGTSCQTQGIISWNVSGSIRLSGISSLICLLSFYLSGFGAVSVWRHLWSLSKPYCFYCSYLTHISPIQRGLHEATRDAIKACMLACPFHKNSSQVSITYYWWIVSQLKCIKCE